jgi:eukaryotic-like serine/threonine-protein kinase
VAFDPAAERVLGDPKSLGDLDVATAADNGAADFALSETGTLAFLSPSSGAALRTLQWIDRGGQRQSVGLEPGPYGYPRVSPDGSRVALDLRAGGNRDIWVLTLDRLNLTRLTDGPTEDLLAVWSRDGRRVFFASDRTGNFDVYSQAADGASEPRVEFAGPGLQMTQSMTPDGSQLIVNEDFTDTSVLDLASPGRLVPLLNVAATQMLGTVSPDGKWIAYESDEAGGRFEIFVRPFPQVSERREKISLDGGRFPLWGPAASHELYYVNLEGGMMAASITLSPALAIGRVTKLFDFQKPPAGRSGIPYDVSPDGRFLAAALEPDGTQAPTQVSVVLNWLPLPARR